MAGTVFMVDSVDTDSDSIVDTPKYRGEMVRQALSALCGVAPSDRPLGASSGVRPGTPTDIVTATSTAWTVTPFSGVLDVQTSATAGPYLFAFASNQTGTITAADATNARWDLLSVQVSDPAEDATTTPKVEIVYTAGTAASSPALPTDPDRSMQLAKIVVPKSGGGDPSIVWLAPTCGVPTITDWNDAIGTGPFTAPAGTTNAPTADDSYFGLSIQDGATTIQTANVRTTTASSYAILQRVRYSGTWGDWRRLAGVPPLFVAYQATAQPIPNITYTDVLLDTEVVDSHGGHSTSSNKARYVAPIDGWYDVSAQVFFAHNTSGARDLIFAVNGTQTAWTFSQVQAAGGDSVQGDSAVYLAAGDYVTVQAYQASGASLSTAANWSRIKVAWRSP